MQHYFTVLLLFYYHLAFTQHNIVDTQENLRSFAMGKIHAVVIQPRDGISNPASACLLSASQFSLQSGNYYLLNQQFNFGLNVSKVMKRKFGMAYSLFHETGPVQSNLFSASFSHALNKEAAIGFRLNYTSFVSAENFRKHGLSADFGLHTKINKNLYAGCLFKNPFPLNLKNGLKANSVMEIAILYTNQSNLNFCTQWRSSNLIQHSIQVGFEYLPVQYFPCRMGFDVFSSNYYFGFGFYKFPKIRFDISASLHMLLGSGISLACSKEF